MKKPKILLIIFALSILCLIPTIGILASKNSDFVLDGNILVKYVGSDIEVTIPKGINTIGMEAFAEAYNVEEIKIPEGVVEIGYGAFYGLENLREVKLPNSLEILGSESFYNCAKLESVNIGTDLKKVKDGAFVGCETLNTIKISKNNKYFCFEDGVLYNRDKSHIIALLPGRESDTYNMPSSVVSMEEHAFYGNNKLKNVTMSNNLVSIPAYAFADCRKLSNVTLTYSIKSIGINAFANCVALKSLEIPPSINDIHATAFLGSGLDENADTDDVIDDDVIDDDALEDGEDVTVDEDEKDVIGKGVIIDNEAVIFID